MAMRVKCRYSARRKGIKSFILHIHPLKKLLSFFYPVRVKSTGHSEQKVSLYYYRNQWQLATIDAIYSDGNRYRPLVVAFKHIDKHLPTVSTALVLGAGLGSAKDVLGKMGCEPSITFVDKNKETLQWAKELHESLNHSKDIYHCEDAAGFIQCNTARFSLVVVDIFDGRVVPEFVLQQEFLRQCKTALCPKGILVMNYIQQQKEQWHTFQKTFTNIFPQNEILPLGINKVLIAYNLAD